MIGRTLGLSLGLSLAVALAGCTALAPINLPITQIDPDGGYRIGRLLKREQADNNPEGLVLLAFSGGGTRAAALSYGVLEELRRTPISNTGQPGISHTLLDEVDLVAGVSGGSFTALAYALYGDRLFTEFESRFPEARRAGRADRASTEPAQLAQARQRVLWSLRARRRLLRRDPVPRRDLR